MLLASAFLLLGNLQAAKKVFTLGDSTMANYEENTTNTRGWGMYFGNFLTDGWTSVNCARGGRDSRGGYNELWQNVKNNVGAGDYVLIQFAHNDEKYGGMDNLELQDFYTAKGDAENAAAVKKDGRGTVPSTTYKKWLKLMVDEVKAKGATPVLVSAVCRCYFSGGTITRAGRHDLGDKFDAIVNGEIKTGQKVAADDHSMDYSYHMQQLASEEGVAFIDMTAATKELYERYRSYDKCYAALFDKGGEADNTHYNLTGALTAAQLCAQLMKNQGILADHIEIPADLAFAPAKADLGDVYVGQSGVKELTLSGLGLTPASGTATITASDGILLSTDRQNWQTTLTCDYTNGTLIKTFYAKVTITAARVFEGTITASTGQKQVDVPLTVNGIELGGGTPFTATWPLATGEDVVIDGEAVAAAAKVEGMVKYGNTSENGLLVSTSENGTWVKAEDDSPNQYVQFSLTAPDGKTLDINRIAMKVGGRGGNGMRCHVYYSTDGFVTRTTIYSPTSMASGVMNQVEATPVVSLADGDQLQIRVYPWYTGNATGKWLCIADVQVGGQSKDAAGVNIQGIVAYALDKGGLGQASDVVMTPHEMNAGFAAKKWSAGDMLTVAETLQYKGSADEAAIPQTRIYNATGNSLASSAVADNTLTLTLTPEDGFSFVPTRVGFQAARYGTDSGNISATMEAGSSVQQLVSNAAVNRSDKGLTIKSFSEEVNGITATADKPLKLSFSFLGLGKTKAMGLSNVVIEGALVGAAAQVTKYVLTTPVVPAEGGTVSRDPDMEQYKAGTKVTLTAQKNFGYRFVEWQDAAGATVTTAAETTVSMDAEKTMKAVFEAVPVYTVKTLTTNDADRSLGSVTLSPDEHDGRYEAGTRITATANESKILKFMQWTDDKENHGAGAERTLTVGEDMTLTADYEVQDFIAVFDASAGQSYAYTTTEGYPFAADVAWDGERQAKASVVKTRDGSLVYTNADGSGVPVVRNRESAVLQTINGLFQNGYRASDIAFQYQFSTNGFTAATFEADMAAKNAATKHWKALYSTDGTTFKPLGSGWEMTANVLKAISLPLPSDALGQPNVFVRITGSGTELLSDKYQFSKQYDGLDYATNSECGVGNVFILGEAVVADDEQAPVVTATIPADGATGISATGRITVTFDERIEKGNTSAPATLRTASGSAVNVTPVWSNRSVSFDYSGLDYNRQYTFQMPAGYVQDRSGNQNVETVTVSFSTMDRPKVEKALYDAVVSNADELSKAISQANKRQDKTSRYRIFVKKGTYKLPTGATKHYVHKDNDGVVRWEGDLPDPITYLTAANISLIGEDRDATIITQDISNGSEMLFDGQFGTAHKYEEIGNSAVLQLEGSATGTYFQDITVKSGINDALGRNLAIHDKSSNTIYKNTLLYGYQDTWTSNNQNGLYYFEDGQVRGRTDYLCGKGDAYFNRLELLQMSGGYAAVPSTPRHVGWVFKDCIISASGSGVNGTYTLGRPWGKGTPVAVFIDTRMTVTPKTEGWNEMSGGWPARFAEYNSVNASGSAIDLKGRKTVFATSHTNNPVLTIDEAAAYGDMAAMFGDWQPSVATEQAPIPAGVKATDMTLTWDDSDYTLLWAVCKDGVVVAFTTVPTYTAAVAGKYSVRAANEMGGLSRASVTVSLSESTGLTSIPVKTDTGQGGYNLNGQRVSRTHRGIVVSDGRKVIRK